MWLVSQATGLGKQTGRHSSGQAGFVEPVFRCATVSTPMVIETGLSDGTEVGFSPDNSLSPLPRIWISASQLAGSLARIPQLHILFSFFLPLSPIPPRYLHGTHDTQGGCMWQRLPLFHAHMDALLRLLAQGNLNTSFKNAVSALALNAGYRIHNILPSFMNTVVP